MNVDRAFIDRLSDELNELVHDIEDLRNAVVSPTVKQFLHDVIVESVTFAKQEWRTLHFRDCDDPKHLPGIIDISIEVARDLLDRAPIDTDGRIQVITLRGLQKEIHGDWCRIFPFCR